MKPNEIVAKFTQIFPNNMMNFDFIFIFISLLLEIMSILLMNASMPVHDGIHHIIV